MYVHKYPYILLLMKSSVHKNWNIVESLEFVVAQFL